MDLCRSSFLGAFYISGELPYEGRFVALRATRTRANDNLTLWVCRQRGEIDDTKYSRTFMTDGNHTVTRALPMNHRWELLLFGALARLLAVVSGLQHVQESIASLWPVISSWDQPCLITSVLLVFSRLLELFRLEEQVRKIVTKTPSILERETLSHLMFFKWLEFSIMKNGCRNHD
jgi:hypothetical protein